MCIYTKGFSKDSSSKYDDSGKQEVGERVSEVTTSSHCKILTVLALLELSCFLPNLCCLLSVPAASGPKWTKLFFFLLLLNLLNQYIKVHASG